MAIVVSTAYPGQTVGTDPAYPLGKARNEIVEGDGSGTPLEADWLNDLLGWQQNLLDESGITPSGNPDRVGASDYTDAIKALIDASIAAAANAQLAGTHSADVAAGFSTSTDWSLGVVSSFGFRPEFVYGAARQKWSIPIYPPHGSILTSATARIIPFATPTGTDRMNVRVIRQAADSTPTHVNGATAYSPNGEGADSTVTVNTPGHVVDTVNYAYRIVVESGVLTMGDDEYILGASFTTAAP